MNIRNLLCCYLCKMTSKRLACNFCETCSKPAVTPSTRCVARSVPLPKPVTPVVPVVPVVPTPIPVVPTPKPPVVPVVPHPSSSTSILESIVTQDMWDKIFPYADLSAVYSPTDKIPIYRREDLFEAVRFMNNLPDKRFAGFCSSSDMNINKYEIAAFFANATQETSDLSLTAPFPWLWPKADPLDGPEAGLAGGLITLLESLYPQVVAHKKGTPAPYKGPLSCTLGYDDFRPAARKTLGLRPDDVLTSVITTTNAFMPGFALGPGGSGAVFQPGLVAVSDDGTLYGDEPKSTRFPVRPTKDLKTAVNDRSTVCKGAYCTYAGKSLTQLSYNYNVCSMSMDVFGDYRVAKYPNLIVTTDRKTWNGVPELFGFPGPNPGGKNVLPDDIDKTTPNGRVMGWLSYLWFWQIPQSGRPISCHECALNPTTAGIVKICQIVNNQTGLVPGSWAEKKILCYKRICGILGVPIANTILSSSDWK